MNTNTLIPYKDFLADTYALIYLHSLDTRDLLVLLLSKFRIHVSTLTLHEFLSYIYYKYHNYELLTKIIDLFYKLYIVENLDKETIIKSSLLLNDLVKHNVPFDLIDVFNVAIAMLKNIPVLTNDPERYRVFSKYGVVAISVEDLLSKFENLLRTQRV
ncbi:MAG: hypothetical protein QXT75_06920 [Desulfurococcaceae archaeon]